MGLTYAEKVAILSAFAANDSDTQTIEISKSYIAAWHEHNSLAKSNMPKNAAKYQPGAVALMKRRIMAAAKQYGIAIDVPTAKSEGEVPESQPVVDARGQQDVEQPVEKSATDATPESEEPDELALASARFAKSGPCVGDQYEIVPRQGFSLLKSRGIITEVLPNGMVGLEMVNHLGVTKRDYVHRVELTTQMAQGRIALTKSGGSADDENVTGKMCAKCGEHPVSTDLPLSGYCDECLTVPRHWW